MEAKEHKQFKKDFNSQIELISNEVLLRKYSFNSVKEMCDYARANNLMIIKEKTKEEKEHLELFSKGLNEAMELLK